MLLSWMELSGLLFLSYEPFLVVLVVLTVFLRGGRRTDGDRSPKHTNILYLVLNPNKNTRSRVDWGM